MIFLETPANPTLRVFDLTKLSEIAHAYKKDILVVVDNTCLTAYFQVSPTLSYIKYFVS